MVVPNTSRVWGVGGFGCFSKIPVSSMPTLERCNLMFFSYIFWSCFKSKVYKCIPWNSNQLYIRCWFMNHILLSECLLNHPSGQKSTDLFFQLWQQLLGLYHQLSMTTPDFLIPKTITTTVDGGNTAPVDKRFIPLLTRFYRSQVVVWYFRTINSITMPFVSQQTVP